MTNSALGKKGVIVSALSRRVIRLLRYPIKSAPPIPFKTCAQCSDIFVIIYDYIFHTDISVIEIMNLRTKFTIKAFFLSSLIQKYISILVAVSKTMRLKFYF